MKEKGKLMNSQEVADYLGVTRQTISNWAKSGILNAHTNSRISMFSREQIEGLADRLRTTAENEQKLNELETKVADKLAELQEEWNDFSEENNVMTRTNMQGLISIVRGVITCMCKATNDELLTLREERILQDVFMMKPYWEIAEKYNVSTNTIVTLVHRITEKLSNSHEQIKERLEVSNENEELKNEIEILRFKNAQLRQKIKEEDRRQKEYEEKILLYSKSIKDFEISFRTQKVIRFFNIETVGDLCALTMGDVLSVRNIGKKSFIELKDLLDELGLSFCDTTWKEYKEHLKENDNE